MKFRVDLHVHSMYSGDNDSDPEESVLRAIELDLQGIAFTEHYHYSASEPGEALRKKYCNRIRIFRGVEFSCAEGHCLVFGVDTDKLSIKYAPIVELLRLVNDAGGVVIPSHPYRKGNGVGDLVERLNGICAVEGFNGCNMHAYNEKAVLSARKMNIPFTGGSDAHAPGEVGMCFTEFASEVTEDDLVYQLKKGNYRGVDARRTGVKTGSYSTRI